VTSRPTIYLTKKRTLHRTRIESIKHCSHLGGNSLTELDTCSFYGLQRTSSQTAFHIHLRSNQLEYLHPCTFYYFVRSTIHVENNPLVCNCSFNYLLQHRQSLAYTGQECRGGYAYQSQNHFSQPAVRKTQKFTGKKLSNTSHTCRNTFKYYNNLCPKWDCAHRCSTNQHSIIQITTIATPSRTRTIFRRTFDVYLCTIIHVVVYFRLSL
jgi:hypothetical protein